jgi:hypothetical protein
MTKSLLGRLTVEKASNPKFWYADHIGSTYFITEDCGGRWSVLHRYGIDPEGTEYWVEKEDARIEPRTFEYEGD